MHDATSHVMLQLEGYSAVELQHVCICVVASMRSRDSKPWALQPHEILNIAIMQTCMLHKPLRSWRGSRFREQDCWHGRGEVSLA